MADLDTLRPEVRAAINRQDRQEKCDEYCPVCEDRATIRAELLRLATIEADALIALDCEHDWQVEHKRAEKAKAELLRLTGENARLNKIESLATEQRLQMEDVELYLMDVSQPDDEDAPWCDRMKSAIELLVQDCNYAVGQKNKAEAELAAALKANRDCVDHFEQMQDELAALKARIAEAPLEVVESLPGAVGPPWPSDHWIEVRMADPCACVGQGLIGKRVRLVVEE